MDSLVEDCKNPAVLLQNEIVKKKIKNSISGSFRHDYAINGNNYGSLPQV